MALLAVFAKERGLEQRMSELLEPEHSIALGHSWGGMLRLIRERPVAGTIVELGAVDPLPSTQASLVSFRAQFPGLGLILVIPHHPDPRTLFRLGRAGIQNLVLLTLEGRRPELRRALARAGQQSATATVMRLLSPLLPRREQHMAFLAMDSVHRRWSAEDLAEEVGLTRPFLSERMKALGLPSLGHFLLWTRLFHAGFWLQEPGRTGESIGRQLEYSSGAAFRRALKRYTGATPTQVREKGGLLFVLREFFSRFGLPAPTPRSGVTLA
jgi:AraC-like DNA-binding protein